MANLADLQYNLTWVLDKALSGHKRAVQQLAGGRDERLNRLIHEDTELLRILLRDIARQNTGNSGMIPEGSHDINDWVFGSIRDDGTVFPKPIVVQALTSGRLYLLAISEVYLTCRPAHGNPYANSKSYTFYHPHYARNNMLPFHYNKSNAPESLESNTWTRHKWADILNAIHAENNGKQSDNEYEDHLEEGGRFKNRIVASKDQPLITSMAKERLTGMGSHFDMDAHTDFVDRLMRMRLNNICFDGSPKFGLCNGDKLPHSYSNKQDHNTLTLLQLFDVIMDEDDDDNSLHEREKLESPSPHGQSIETQLSFCVNKLCSRVEGFLKTANHQLPDSDPELLSEDLKLLVQALTRNNANIFTRLRSGDLLHDTKDATALCGILYFFHPDDFPLTDVLTGDFSFSWSCLRSFLASKLTTVIIYDKICEYSNKSLLTSIDQLIHFHLSTPDIADNNVQLDHDKYEVFRKRALFFLGDLLYMLFTTCLEEIRLEENELRVEHYADHNDNGSRGDKERFPQNNTHAERNHFELSNENRWDSRIYLNQLPGYQSDTRINCFQNETGLPNHGQPAPYRLTQSQSESHGQYFNDHGGVGTKNNSNIDSHYNYQLPNKYHTYNKCPFATNDMMYRSNILMNHQPPNLPLPNFAEAKPNNHFQTNLRNASRYNCNSGVNCNSGFNRNSPYGHRINGDNDNNNRYYQNRHQQLSSSNPKTRMEARKQHIRQISRYARRGNTLPNSKSALSVVDCDSLTNNLLSLGLNSRTNNPYYLDHHQFETESLVTNSTNFRHSSSSSPSNGGSYFAAANRNVVPKTRQPYITLPQHPNNIHHRHPNDVDNYNSRKSGHHCQPELMYDNDIRETINKDRTRDFGTLGAHYIEEGYRDGNIKEEEYIRRDEKERPNNTYLEYQPDRFNRHNTAAFSSDRYDYNSYNGDKRGQPNNPLPYVIPYSSISGTGGGSSATVFSNSVAYDSATGENVPSFRDRYNYHSYNGDKRSQPINSPPFIVPYLSISGPLGTSTVTVFGNCNTHDTVTDENVASSCERYNDNSYENDSKSKPNNHPPCVIPHLGISGPHGGSSANVLSKSATYDTHTSENLILARTVNDGNGYQDLRSTSGDFLTRRSQDNLQRLEASYVIDAHRNSDGTLATPRDHYTPFSTRLGHDPSNHGTVNVLMGKISKLDIDDQKTPRPAKVSLFPPGANFNKSPSLPPSSLSHSSSSNQPHHDSDVKKSMGFVVPLDHHPFKNESTSCSGMDTELGISRDEDLDESIIKRKEIIILNVVKRRAEMEASKAKNNAKAAQAREKMMAKQIELEKKREEVKERKQAILINYLEAKRARNNTDVPPCPSKTVLPFNQPSPTHSTSDSKLVSSLASYGNEEYRLKPQLPQPQNQAKNSIKTTSQRASGIHFNEDSKDKRILGNSASFKGFKSSHRKWLPQEPTAELTRDAEDINGGRGLLCRKEIVLVKRSFNRRPLSAAKSQYSLRDIQEEQGNEFETGINLESLQENPFTHTHICPRYQESFKNSNVSLSTTASQKSTIKIFSNNNNGNHNRIKNGGLKMSKSINGKNTSHTCSSTSVSSSTSAIAQSATNGSSRVNAKLSERSNRNLIIQALSYSVLAGPVNTDVKTRAIEAMNRSLEHKQFIILFRDRQMQYRALYQRTNQPDGLELYKIHGLGPKLIVADQDGIIQYFYKYNCGSKSFMQIPSKQLSATIDGIVLKEFYWINLKLSKK